MSYLPQKDDEQRQCKCHRRNCRRAPFSLTIFTFFWLDNKKQSQFRRFKLIFMSITCLSSNDKKIYIYIIEFAFIYISSNDVRKIQLIQDQRYSYDLCVPVLKTIKNENFAKIRVRLMCTSTKLKF